MSTPAFRIYPARTHADLDAARTLFTAYAISLPVDLSYQSFDAELAGLPGKYAPPVGEILLARNHEAEPVGVVALRPIEPDGCCEMKRLFVSPEGRGLGLGRALAEAIIAEARRIGYRELRLDTLATMTQAQALYQRLGFETIEPYYETPIPGTIFLRLNLTI